MTATNQSEVITLADEKDLDTNSGHGAVLTLPCGYIDQAGNLHKEVELREMTGVEEDVLVSPANGKGNAGLNKVLTNCIVRLGDLTEKEDIAYAVANLRLGDRFYLVVQLRRLSLGDEYSVEVTCPECRKRRVQEIDLSSLQKQTMPEPNTMVHEVTLPSGLKATIIDLTAKDENKLDMLAKQHSNDFISATMHLRVKELNGERLASPARLQNLSVRDRAELRNALERIDGGIETDVDFQCGSCGCSFRATLPVDQRGFFFPSGTSKR